MAYVVEINYNEIPSSDIVKYPTHDNKISFPSGDLIGTTDELILNNSDGNYSDTNSNSIFYGVEWLNKLVTVYDDVNNIYTWVGRIKNLTIKEKEKTVVVKIANYVRELADVTCVYSDTGITIAEAIYNILHDVVEVPEGFINYGSFINVKNIHTQNSVTIDIIYTAEHNAKCLSVIQSLLRMTQCDLYTENNVIILKQWSEWEGVGGYRLKANDIIPLTFESTFEENIYNAYSVAYDNSGTVAYATGSVAGSAGDKIWTVPKGEVESTSSTDFKILLDNQTGADWCGNLTITRYQYPIKTFKLKLDDHMTFVRPYDQLDLDFDDWIGEPTRLTRVKYDPSDNEVEVEGEFLNLPVNVVSRDVEAPDPIELITVIPLSGGARVIWNQSTASELLGYKLYFTSTIGEWRSETSNLGQSPIGIKQPETTLDGYAYIDLHELNDNTEYFFRVSCYDTSYNESIASNTMRVIPYSSPIVESMYCCDRDSHLSVVLDPNNTNNGTAPAEEYQYDEFLYDEQAYQPTARYTSQYYYHPTGWDYIEWRGAGNVYISIRTSDDGDTWSDWTGWINAVTISQYTLSGALYVQYRVMYLGNWIDNDYFYIRKLEVA